MTNWAVNDRSKIILHTTFENSIYLFSSEPHERIVLQHTPVLLPSAHQATW